MKTVIIERKDDVAIVRMNRPEALNALNVEMTLELLETFKSLRDDESVRAVVLTGQGRAFCSGADVPEMLRRDRDRGRSIRNWLNDDLNPMVRAILDLPKPIISAVNGVAAGGGLGLAFFADIVFAAESSKFVAVFGPKLSVLPDLGASWFLANLLPRGRGLPVMLTGEPISAKQAEEWGLIWKCTKDEDLLAAALETAHKLADGPVKAFAAIRHGSDHARQVDLSEQLDYERDTNGILCGTRSFEEGIRAFTEKRKPDFRPF